MGPHSGSPGHWSHGTSLESREPAYLSIKGKLRSYGFHIPDSPWSKLELRIEFRKLMIAIPTDCSTLLFFLSIIFMNIADSSRLVCVRVLFLNTNVQMNPFIQRTRSWLRQFSEKGRILRSWWIFLALVFHPPMLCLLIGYYPYFVENDPPS